MVKRSMRQQVYEAIKGMLRDGKFRPGERIEAGVVAMQLHVSASPVRDSLHTLAGELLVEAHAHEGFSAPAFTEGGLRDLYWWNRQHLLAAVELGHYSPLIQSTETIERLFRDLQIADATAQVFAVLVRQAGNAEVLRSLVNINERLARPRALESQVLGHTVDELLAIYEAWHRRDFAALRQLLITYFDRRTAVIADLVRLLYEITAN